MIEDNNKVVYIHRKKTNGVVFYVGIGNPDRPYKKSKESRSIYWTRTANKHGVDVEVVKRNLSSDDACDIEIALISFFGRRDLGTGTLVNLTDGGEGVVGCNSRGKECYDIETGKVYKNIAGAAEDIGMNRTTLIAMMQEDSGRINTSPVRTFANPYPEDKLPKGTDYLEEQKGYDSGYVDAPEFNDYETETLRLIDLLPEDDYNLLERSYDTSVSSIAKELGLSYKSTLQRLKDIKKGILSIVKPEELLEIEVKKEHKPKKQTKSGAFVFTERYIEKKEIKCMKKQRSTNVNDVSPSKNNVNYYMEKYLEKQRNL